MRCRAEIIVSKYMENCFPLSEKFHLFQRNVYSFRFRFNTRVFLNKQDATKCTEKTNSFKPVLFAECLH